MSAERDSIWEPVKQQPQLPDNPQAPKGTIWVCAACGKTARHIYNEPGSWDESCMLNAVLCHDKEAQS